MIYNSKDFEFAYYTAQKWRAVRQELLALSNNNFIPWHEEYLYNFGWKVFGLYAFGTRIDENCELCPETTKLAESIPGMVTAGFSTLKPGTRINPHQGQAFAYKDGKVYPIGNDNSKVLRCHLGLIVPQIQNEYECALRVGDRLTTWQEGEWTIFDDTITHSAWNLTQETRVVLLVDFQKKLQKLPVMNNDSTVHNYV